MKIWRTAPRQKIIFRTNFSINGRLAGELFPRLVESAPDAEAGCRWASLETERYYRTCMYSKAGSTEFREFEDTIRTIGGAVKIYLCNPYYEEEVPVIQLLLELYHKTPYDVYGKPVEPDADWDCGAWYDKLPRTFEYYGETYCYDDGRIEEVCEDDPYDEYGYMENDGDEWLYYDEDDGEYFYPKDFEDEIILRWVYGKLRKEWFLGK